MMTGTIGADPQVMRQAMVASQIRTNAVTDPRLVAAMARVPRERFLPETARTAAYRDTSIPLGHGRWANMPLATARLLNEAELLSSDRVLLIGAAGGYAAALLAEIVAEVVAVEEHPALAALAREALAGLSTVLRARKLMREKIKAMSGEAVASAFIIGSLPPGIMLMVSVTLKVPEPCTPARRSRPSEGWGA